MEAIKKKLRLSAPACIRAAHKEAYSALVDLKERLSGQYNQLIPPFKMRGWVGSAETYRDTAKRFYKIFVEVYDLKQDARVLDVGCGTGRMAYLLTRYLSERGSYEGFDIAKPIIRWCKKTFEPRFPNFHFQYADVYNKMYNPTGKLKASKFKFPFGTNTFDFVFLTSVFTHMLALDVENYMSEISRVLKLGGKCLISWIILNDDSFVQTKHQGDIESSPYAAGRRFPHSIGDGSWIEDKNNPEGAVGYEEPFIRALYRKEGLRIIEPIRFGWWCRRESSPIASQDLVLAIRS